jgi:hypothetical protein
MLISMKKMLLFFTVVVVAFSARAEEIQKNLKPFSRVVASPRINVVMIKGDQESIRLVYSGVNQNDINIEVSGKTLRIYLDYARKIEKNVRSYRHNHSWEGMYKGANITAYVTYKNLKLLEMRGNQTLTCEDSIDTDRFTVRAYGENQITLASLKTEYFKAALYGENILKIKTGKVLEQKYKLFGENKIDTQEMKSEYTLTNIFGVCNVKINSSEEVRVNAFGEPRIYVDGGGQINRRLIFGRARIMTR